jgi:hypothetical protein
MKQGIVPINIIRFMENTHTQRIEVRVAVERSKYENHNTDVK